MSNKKEITIKISIEAHQKLIHIKKANGCSIKWIIDKAVDNYNKITLGNRLNKEK